MWNSTYLALFPQALKLTKKTARSSAEPKKLEGIAKMRRQRG